MRKLPRLRRPTQPVLRDRMERAEPLNQLAPLPYDGVREQKRGGTLVSLSATVALSALDRHTASSDKKWWLPLASSEDASSLAFSVALSFVNVLPVW